MDAERQLAAAESELKRAREAITLMEDKLRVQEVVLQGLKAEAEKAPPVKPGVSSEVRRLSSQLSRTEGKRYAAETALKKAKTTIASLEGRLSVKNALLLESKVDLDKATRAMIDNMYRRALSGETAAEVAQSRIRMLKNQLTETEEVLARARQVIAKLRAERPVEAPRGD
jgi:chromosome segregation ATPase